MVVIKGVVKLWGLKVPVTDRLLRVVSPVTDRFFRKTALSRTLRVDCRVAVPATVRPSATVKDLVRSRPSEIKPDRAWMVLAVEMRLGSDRVK